MLIFTYFCKKILFVVNKKIWINLKKQKLLEFYTINCVIYII